VTVEAAAGRGRTVLVTGAAGLIGSAVVRRLLADGCGVVACDDFSIGLWRGEEPGLVWDNVDVSAPDLPARLSHHHPDAVVHCAAHPGGKSNEEPALDVRVNAFGSMQVFEWCARNGVPVLYLSSSAVYGEQPSAPIPESASLHPGTVYAACKVACEQFLRILEARYGLQWTVLRLFATYGPGHRPGTAQGIVNVMLTQLQAGRRVVVRGSLDRVRDLVFVDDAADAIAACLRSPAARGRVLNVGTGRETTVRGMIQTLCALLDRRLPDVDIVAEAGTVGDPLYSVADARALKAAVGVEPRISLEDGLSRLVTARAGR
jgi:UDP-glucose 4-epimerase